MKKKVDELLKPALTVFSLAIVLGIFEATTFGLYPGLLTLPYIISGSILLSPLGTYDPSSPLDRMAATAIGFFTLMMAVFITGKHVLHLSKPFKVSLIIIGATHVIIVSVFLLLISGANS